MANLSLRHIYKVYPAREKTKFRLFGRKKGNPRDAEDFVAVKDFTMDIDDGEFIVFVGPSGCGKSTTLRMIAGLEDISGGELYIDGKLVNNLEPKDRDIAMVFQSYALYPHMTSYDNIAFGLKMRKVPDVVKTKDGKEKKIMRHLSKAEIDEKVQWAAEILGIKELLYRKPDEMSGGQRQRIALGRALVRGPKAFLLDEPLSNLDAKLRTAMRSEIVKLHNEIKTTFIYVTHDQVEAMTMGTRIVVMKDGVVQQIDTPTNLFDYPVNQFVAGFIGTPQMNFFEVKIKRHENLLKCVFLNGSSVAFDLKRLRPIEERYLDGNEHEAVLGVRGEHIEIAEEGLDCTLSIMEVLGSETHLFVKIAVDGPDYIVSVKDRVRLFAGDHLKIGFCEEKVHLFDKETSLSVMGKK